MKIIGITGSSGSGKTTVSQLFAQKYLAEIINADKVVKEMSVPETEYMKKIEEYFGKEVFLTDGSLNRKLLADKIYSNNEDLETLNKLTFKYVVDEIKKRISAIQNNASIVIIDAPLLIESGLNEICDFIIAVVANDDIKIKRICKRDGLDINTAKKRLQIQKDDKFYIEKANFTIYNNNKENIEEDLEKIIENI